MTLLYVAADVTVRSGVVSLNAFTLHFLSVKSIHDIKKQYWNAHIV